MTRDDVQLAWENIVPIGFSNYKKLSRNQRIWFNIEQIVNGGPWDYYVNYGADHILDTIEDLEYLGFQELVNKLKRFNEQVFPKGVPIGPQARQNIYSAIPDEQLLCYIDELENNFWEQCSEIENALLIHIKNTGIGIL